MSTPAAEGRSTDIDAAGRPAVPAIPLEEILDSIPVLIALHDAETRVLRLNREFERVSGWRSAEALGHPLSELFALEPEQRRELDAVLREVRPGWRDARVCFRDGRRLETAWAALRLADGRLVAVGVDITRRKQAELVLRASEQRFARFMQHLPGLAWIKDGDGRYTYANDAAVSAFGRPKHEIYGHSDEEIFAPETAARFRYNDRQALASDAGVRAIETLRHEDGMVHHSIVSKFPIPAGEGQPPLIGGMAIDVTEWKRAEEALADREARLREADRRKDEFLATLAHELRNPLAPIRNSIQLLRLAGPAAVAEGRVLDLMERQVEHIVRLVDDLLEVSRITLGKIELRRERVDLAAVVRNAVETSRPFLESAGHELLVALPPQRVELHADPVRLAQILANLIHNAAKYTEKPGRIWLAARAEGAELTVSVRDTGVGIAPEMLPRVFELFTQVDGSSAGGRGGLGIGLTLAQTLAALHGGRIEARSEGPGAGSEFIVRLPVVAPSSADKEPAPAEPESLAPRAARRILVADDVRDSAESLGLLLSAWGHEVRLAHSGRETIEAVRVHEPEVIFLDIGLPDLSGYEVARTLRAEPAGAAALLVAVTGFGQSQDRARSREAGIDVHLVKPVDPRELRRLLDAREHPAPASPAAGRVDAPGRPPDEPRTPVD